MKKLDVMVEGKKALEIKVEDNNLDTLLKIISIFESGKINS